ncbi:MAG: hypothetical protein IPF50_17125 [Proteobacteria bacterium]|nr:hypothetical protein [Pseudomonadota bacterium]
MIATSALNASAGFSRAGPSAVVVIGYGIASYFLSLAPGGPGRRDRPGRAGGGGVGLHPPRGGVGGGGAHAGGGVRRPLTVPASVAH